MSGPIIPKWFALLVIVFWLIPALVLVGLLVYFITVNRYGSAIIVLIALAVYCMYAFRELND
jgi:hypothetical protein